MSGGLDVIKQYLISIGFDIDKSSMDKVNKAMSDNDQKIKKSSNEVQKNTSETSNLLKGMYDLISTMPTIKEIIPPSLLRDISQLYNYISSIKKNKIDSSTKENVPKSKENTDNTSLIVPNNTDKKVKQELDRTKNALTQFTSQSSSELLKFATKSAAYIGIVITAFKALKDLVSKAIEVLGDLADADIGYEKLARQLWTTKENAREVTKALDTLGASMQDLWLSPTLLKQFNQLRKDSSALKLPPEYKENLKIVQNIGLEWKRTKQLGSIALEWIGNSIMKYCKEPLDSIRRLLHNGNNYLVKALPKIADLIGKCISVPLKIIFKLFEGILTIGNTFGKAISFFNGKLDNTSTRTKKILSILKECLSIFNLFLLPIKAAYLVIDDIFTFLTGGKSVIGYILDLLKEKIDNLIDPEKIKEKINSILEGTELGKLISNISNWIGNALDYIDKYIDDIKERLSKIPVIGNLFEGSNKSKDNSNMYSDDSINEDDSESKGIASSIGSTFKKIAPKLMFSAVPGFESLMNAKNLYDTFKNSDSSYYSTSTSNTTSTNNSNNNNNNTVNNYNTYNITGTDAHANASAISSRQNQITTRSLQGRFY
jgi:hypothetical protein